MREASQLERRIGSAVMPGWHFGADRREMIKGVLLASAGYLTMWHIENSRRLRMATEFIQSMLRRMSARLSWVLCPSMLVVHSFWLKWEMDFNCFFRSGPSIY